MSPEHYSEFGKKRIRALNQFVDIVPFGYFIIRCCVLGRFVVLTMKPILRSNLSRLQDL